MNPRIPGDQVSASVLVEVPQAEAFRVFTEEIDQWWRAGLRFRNGVRGRSVLCIEPKLGGRMFEQAEGKHGAQVFERGRVTLWEPPQRFVLTWRAENFAPGEDTEVDVCFATSRSGTLVTVVHRGWSKIRSDHPVRHGEAVPGFIRMMASWWGDLMSALREYTAP